MRPVSGVLYHGRFYADATPIGRPHSSTMDAKRTTPYKVTDMQKYYDEREEERKYIQKMHMMKTKKFNKNCSGCQLLEQRKPCLHMDYLKTDKVSSDTDEILDDNPFQNNVKQMFESTVRGSRSCSTKPTINPIHQRSKYSPCCVHCHKICHLCTCTCNCQYCRANKICRCVDCAIQRRRAMLKELDEQLEDIHFNEVREMRNLSDAEQRIYEESRQKKLISDLRVEGAKLQQQLINCQTREEAGRIKSRILMNRQLIQDCEELLNSHRNLANQTQQTDNLPFASVGVQRSACKIHDRGSVGLTAYQFPEDELSTPPMPKPSQHPRAVTCTCIGDSSDPILEAENDSKYESYRLQAKSLFGKRARQDFEQTGLVQAVISPTIIQAATQGNLMYLGEFVEPQLFVGIEILQQQNHEIIFKKLRNFAERYTLSAFERNCYWALVCFVCRRLTEDFLITLNKSYNCNRYDVLTFSFKISQIVVTLPCQRSAQPPHALLSSKYSLKGQQIATDVANIAIPYFGRQALLPKALRVEKQGRFDHCIYFDSSRLQSAVEQAIYCISKYIGGVLV